MKSNVTLFLLALICLLSFGQLQRFEVVPGVVVYLHDFLITGFVSYLLWQQKQGYSLTKLKKLLFSHQLITIWVGWLLLSLIINSFLQFQLTPWLYLLRISLYTSFALLVGQHFPPKMVQRGLILLGLLYTWFGLLQYVFLPDTRFLSVWGWDDHYYRLISTLLDPAFTGLILVYTWLVIDQQDFNHKLSQLLKCIVLVALSLTFSRSSYLALSTSLIVLFFNQHTRKSLVKVGGWLIFFFFLILIIPKPAGEGVKLNRSASLIARQTAGQETMRELTTKDLLIGDGIFAPLRAEKSTWIDLELINHARLPDNWLVFFLKGSGLIGLGLTLAVIMRVFWLDWQKSPLIVTLMSALLVHSFFNASLTQPFVFLFGSLVFWSEQSKQSTD